MAAWKSTALKLTAFFAYGFTAGLAVGVVLSAGEKPAAAAVPGAHRREVAALRHDLAAMETRAADEQRLAQTRLDEIETWKEQALTLTSEIGALKSALYSLEAAAEARQIELEMWKERAKTLRQSIDRLAGELPDW